LILVRGPRLGLCMFTLFFLHYPGTLIDIIFSKVAEKYPSAEVIGIYFSMMKSVWVPPNATLYIDDINSPKYKEYRKYDVIHLRERLGSVFNWPKLFKELFK
jgi:hypothetical protein